MEFLRPSFVVTVCSDTDDNVWVENYIRFIDIERKALMHEVRMTYQHHQHFEALCPIRILGRDSLACVLRGLPGLGLFLGLLHTNNAGSYGNHPKE